jgi:hypothetical protein
MTNRPLSRLYLAAAATMLLGLSACSSSAHKNAVSGANAAQGSGAASSTGKGAALSDAALQTALQQAAVVQSDLPSGWNSSLTMTDAPADAGGYSAIYTALFSQAGAGGSGGTSLVVTLTGFSDAKAAGAQFTTGSGKFSIQSAGGKAAFNTNDLKLGDAALSSQITSPSGDIAEVIWRRGRVTAVVLLTLPGGAQSQGMDQAITIAKAQDAKLASAGL